MKGEEFDMLDDPKKLRKRLKNDFAWSP